MKNRPILNASYDEFLYRLRSYIASNCTQYSLFLKLGGRVMSFSTLSNKLRGWRRMDVNELIKMLEVFPNLNTAWLLRGEGSPEIVGQDGEKSEEYVNFEKRIALHINKCEAKMNALRDIISKRDARIRELEEELLILKKQNTIRQ